MKQSKTVSVAEISFATLAKKHRISSMEFYGFRPAVIKIEAGYSIRTMVGMSFGTTYTTRKYDYFTLDQTGLITKSPRGLASKYNQKVRIIDIDRAVEEYKDKAC